MKKIKRKFLPWKTQDKKGSLSSDVDLKETKHHVFDQGGGQEAPKNFIQRRTSDGDLYTHKRSASASSYSLNLERHGTVHEARHDAAITLPSRAGSYRRLTSREKEDRPAFSLEDLHKTSMEQKKESPDSNSVRSASLDRRKIIIYVEGIQKQDSQECEDSNGKSRDNTSDEEDLDKTPTDVTPMGSSASDLTPTGSMEDMRLKMSIKKRFSDRWWKEKYRRRSIAEGLASQTAASAAISLPHINQLSDYEEDQPTDEPQTETSPGHDPPKQSRNNKRADKGKKAKLKRRRAYYRTPKDGRSKSLTHIDTLEDSGMLLSGEEMEGREGATDKLGVPDPHSIRRRKLSLATKVSSCEYLALVLECYDEPLEEFVQATRGTSLRSLFVPSLPSQEVGRTRNVKGNLRMVRNFLVKRL